MAKPELKSIEFAEFVAVPLPAQQRSREALDRFLLAGEVLLANNAFEEASVTEIAQSAESSVGTFYRVLGDKDTLSQLLLQRFFQAKVANIDAITQSTQWQSRTLDEFISALIESLVSTYAGRRGVLRALILRASRDADFRDRVHKLNEYIAQRVVLVIQSHQQEVHHPKPRKAMQAAVHILLGALNQHTVTGNLGHLSAKELIEELTRMTLSYLDVHQ